MALLDDPLGVLQKRAEEQQRQREEKQREEDARRKFDEAWAAVINSHTPAPLLELGRLLVQTNNQFWIDYWCISMDRDTAVLGGEFWHATYWFAATAKMLDAACRQNQSGLRRLILQAHGMPELFNWASAFADTRDILKLWIQEGHPPDTPYLLRKELVAAMKGVPAMSGSSITRMVRKDRLKLTQTVRKHSKYRHENPETHRHILSKVVEYLDGQKSSFHRR